MRPVNLAKNLRRGCETGSLLDLHVDKTLLRGQAVPRTRSVEDPSAVPSNASSADAGSLLSPSKGELLVLLPTVGARGPATSSTSSAAEDHVEEGEHPDPLSSRSTDSAPIRCRQGHPDPLSSRSTDSVRAVTARTGAVTGADEDESDQVRDAVTGVRRPYCTHGTGRSCSRVVNTQVSIWGCYLGLFLRSFGGCHIMDN